MKSTPLPFLFEVFFVVSPHTPKSLNSMVFPPLCLFRTLICAPDLESVRNPAPKIESIFTVVVRRHISFSDLLDQNNVRNEVREGLKFERARVPARRQMPQLMLSLLDDRSP